MIKKRLCVLCVLFLAPDAGSAFGQPRAPQEEKPAVTTAELLQPGLFPDAAFGMSVEAADDGPQARVLTTGAEFLVDKANDTIECRQRIAKERTVSQLKFSNDTLAALKLTHQSSGMVIFEGAGTTVRINGDSLLMVAPRNDGPIIAELAFTPDYHAEYKGNHNFFDPYGGISFFEHGHQPASRLGADEDAVTVTWDWSAGDVFWAGVSPPKPYDWAKSIRQRTVLRGSSYQRFMYPSDLVIIQLARLAEFNILYLHAENMWENWQTRLVPQREEEYRRVMRTAQLNGMHVIVYAGPKHFLEGTAIEDRATTSVNDPRSTGWASGSNAKVFMWQLERLVGAYETPGFYFDEMYTNHEALAANYYVARATRKLSGDSAPLFFHSTEDTLGDRRGLVGGTHCPTIHAWFDVIYKGEGIRWRVGEEPYPGYIRYNLGTYNISNSIAVPCMSFEQWPSPQLLDDLMRRANARLIVPEWILYTDQSKLLWDHYFPRLNPGLKEDLEPTLLQRTGAFVDER